MSTFGNNLTTRRTAIASAITSLAMLGSGKSTARQTDRPAPVDLGHGLEIRDYRLFPTEDVMRFIVEIHNTTDTAVDTPTVGVVLPHFDDDNFAWANPVSQVLHPHTSECLIGVAPTALTSDDGWGSTEWMLCEVVHSTLAEKLARWSVNFTFELAVLGPKHARALYDVANNGNKRLRDLYIQGTVWDQEERVCGLLLPSSVHFMEPRSRSEQLINLHPRAIYTSNPFVLIDSVEGISFTCTLQPSQQPVNRSCPAVMPWNR